MTICKHSTMHLSGGGPILLVCI